MEPLLLPESFAELAAGELIESVFDGNLVFDRQQFALVIKSPTGKTLQTTFLYRYYQTYKNEPFRLKDILRDIARASREQGDYTSYERVAPHLMPAVRDYAEHYLDYCHLWREYGDAVGGYEANVWCDHFVVFPVIDTGEKQVRITSRMLKDWSQSYDAVMEQAAKNLIESTEHYDFCSMYDKETNAGCFFESTWNDHYDAVRGCYLKFPDLKVKGVRLYLLVNPCQLLIWGSEDILGTAYALSKLEAMLNSDVTLRQLPPYVLCNGPDGHFKVYKPHPEREEALYTALTRYQIQYQHQSYARQQEFLWSDADVQQNDIFVSKFVAVQARDGSIRSTCTWTETVECLLPRTDSIGFSVVNKDRTEARCIGEVSWPEAVKVLGDRMIPAPGMYPLRFKTVGFPSKDQLHRLGLRR